MVADRVAVLKALAKGEQQPEEVANAALWYLRAIEMWEALPQPNRELLLAFDAAVSKDVPAPVTAALLDVQPILDVVREAASKRRCVFASFVHHRGPPAIAPHYLPGMHELLHVLRCDALRLSKTGDSDSAQERLTVAMRAIAHLGGAGAPSGVAAGNRNAIGDGQLASARAAHVNFNRTLDLIEALREADLLPEHASDALADAAGRISRKDPFGYLDALTRTRDVFIRQRYTPAPDTADALKEWERQTNLIQQFNADQVMVVLVIVDERMRRMIAKGWPPPELQAQSPTPEPDDITSPETIDRLTGVFDAAAVESVRSQFEDIMPRMEQAGWDIFGGQPPLPVAHVAQGMTRARADLRRATRLLLLTDEEEGAATQPQP